MNLKLLLLFASFLMTGCLVPDSLVEHREIVKNTLADNQDIFARYLDTEDFRLHYREVGNAKEGVAVWIHGTPGRWDDAVRLFLKEELTSTIKIVAIDRPGWGESNYLNNPRIVSSFKEQGELISPLLQLQRTENPGVPTFLVGHSWGGSLVPAIALDYPQLVDGIIVAAGGLDPDLTAPRWYNRLGNTWAVGSFLGKGMKAANLEVYALQSQLEELKPEWQNLTLPIIAIQGEEDKLVNPANAEFIEEYFPSAYVLRLPNQGHLLQAERAELLATCILAMSQNQFIACTD